MPVPLTVFARPFLVNPDRRASWTTPVLVWEAAALRPGTQPNALTVAGALGPRPTASDPLVLPVAKGNGKLNAFAMGITVGRTENNDLVIADENVSRFQGYFQQDPKSGRWNFTDAESTNGSFAGPLRLTPSQAHPLGNREHLRFGFVELLFLMPRALFDYLEQRLKD